MDGGAFDVADGRDATKDWPSRCECRIISTTIDFLKGQFWQDVTLAALGISGRRRMVGCNEKFVSQAEGSTPPPISTSVGVFCLD